jgi:ABC-type glycerol-3-phosphate transport system substrate-binding protein
MNDNKSTTPENQSSAIFENVSFDDIPQQIPQNIPTAQPEIPQAVPPLDTAGDAFLNAPPPELTGDLPPVYAYEESKTRYFIIGGAILFFIIIFVVVFAVLLNRGNGGNKTPDPVTLTYWGLWEDKAVLQPIFDEYMKANPHVTINYEKLDPVDYREKLIARSRNGKGPDIFRFHNTWLPQIQEVAVPIPKEIMSQEEYEKTFYKIQQQDLGIDGRYYGIPLSIDGLVMIYNDNLFRKAGITTAPTNWIGDLLETVTALTVQDQQGQIVTSGIAMGTATNIEHFGEIYGILLLQNGGSITSLNTQAAQEALQVYREFAEKNIWNDTMPNNITAFAQEKVAIIIAPSWQILSIKAINPDIPVKVAPVPRGLDGQPLSIATYWVEGVSKFSPNQIEAWKLLTFMASAESQQKIFAEQSKTRLFGSAYSRLDLADKLAQHEYLGPVIQQAEYYRSLPLSSRTFDKGLNDESIAYLENAINATAQGVSYSQALDTAHKGVQQVFRRFGLGIAATTPAAGNTTGGAQPQ